MEWVFIDDFEDEITYLDHMCIDIFVNLYLLGDINAYSANF